MSRQPVDLDSILGLSLWGDDLLWCPQPRSGLHLTEWPQAHLSISANFPLVCVPRQLVVSLPRPDCLTPHKVVFQCLNTHLGLSVALCSLPFLPIGFLPFPPVNVCICDVSMSDYIALLVLGHASQQGQDSYDGCRHALPLLGDPANAHLPPPALKSGRSFTIWPLQIICPEPHSLKIISHQNINGLHLQMAIPQIANVTWKSDAEKHAANGRNLSISNQIKIQKRMKKVFIIYKWWTSLLQLLCIASLAGKIPKMQGSTPIHQDDRKQLHLLLNTKLVKHPWWKK